MYRKNRRELFQYFLGVAVSPISEMDVPRAGRWMLIADLTSSNAVGGGTAEGLLLVKDREIGGRQARRIVYRRGMDSEVCV